MRALVLSLCLSAVVLLLSCDRQPIVVDNSKLSVQPGKGISNICEVGMTLKQLRNATHDVSTHGVNDDGQFWKRWTTSRHAVIQSLGAVAPLETDGKLRTVCFHVVPSRSGETLRGLSITNPFRGKVGGELSFRNGQVSRVDVESQYGVIDSVVTNLLDGVPLANSGKPFLYKAPSGIETLYYRHRGIDFDLRSNSVTRFWIYEAKGSGTSTPN